MGLRVKGQGSEPLDPAIPEVTHPLATCEPLHFLIWAENNLTWASVPCTQKVLTDLWLGEEKR
jgi:hypothetical protein